MVTNIFTEPEVLGAAVGAVTGTLTTLVTHIGFIHRQHVREQRRTLLTKQLSDFYTPLEYHVGVLSDLAASAETKSTSSARIQTLVEAGSYLCSASLRSALYRLSANRYEGSLAAELFPIVREEADVIKRQLYSSHYLTLR